MIDCLGFVKGVACPHYDEERDREPFVNELINKGRISSCICLEGNCALHIKNDNEYKSINFGKEKRCFMISKLKKNFSYEYF